MKRSSLIGDRNFYRRVLTVMAPILIQNVITNFVSLLDNLMVGQVGTEQMSGVAIVNQLIFVFNLCLFGGMAGPGIFTAQFYGSGDREGVRHTVRAKLLVGLGAWVVFSLVLLFGGRGLIGLFTETEDVIAIGIRGLRWLSLGYIAFAVSQVLQGAMRGAGETMTSRIRKRR